MDGDDYGRLIYLGLLLAAVAGWGLLRLARRLVDLESGAGASAPDHGV